MNRQTNSCMIYEFCSGTKYQYDNKTFWIMNCDNAEKFLPKAYKPLQYLHGNTKPENK